MSLATKLLQTRWLVRAPIVLFRARLGFLFGGRILLLEHVGRSSGRPRYVVLEAVERPDRSHVVVASGFGERANWYRNLLAEPNCHVSIGFSHRRSAVATVLSTSEAAAVLDRYRSAHPRAYRQLSSVVAEATGSSIEDVPFVELALQVRDDVNVGM